jgi:hypothetical protein
VKAIGERNTLIASAACFASIDAKPRHSGELRGFAEARRQRRLFAACAVFLPPPAVAIVVIAIIVVTALVAARIRSLAALR